MKRAILLLAAFAALTFGASAQEIKSDIVNPGTRKFLQEVDYSDDPEYTVSYAMDYRKEFKASDRPLPVTVSWTEENATMVRVSVPPFFENAVEVKVDTTFAQVYNLIPGVKYFYEVLDADDKVLTSGNVTPVGPLRMIYGVTGNFRDLGGWPADGGHI